MWVLEIATETSDDQIKDIYEHTNYVHKNADGKSVYMYSALFNSSIDEKYVYGVILTH